MNNQIIIKDRFWSHYREIVRREMIPFQWKVLNDEINVNIERERDDNSIPNEKSHAIKNFKIAAGLEKGEHYGWVFQDSDVYKWLEAVSYCLSEKMDKDLKELADQVVILIAKAQEEDGYLNTYFTIRDRSKRFTRIYESHELYCAGHFLEAAVAYYQATHNELVLETARRLANCIDRSFGYEEGKIHTCDGHEEIEIGLMKLYHLTGEQKYLKLSDFFLQMRGRNLEEFEKPQHDSTGELIPGVKNAKRSYFQMHLPVKEQTTAEGHAVRLVYLCTAMADVAYASGDQEYLDACKRIWRNIVDKRMYITGGIGSTVSGEAFTFDYDLPNDTMYCETCASVGLIFFAKKMLQNERNSEYADVMERALYNAALGGMALDGKHFFYVNPLEVLPEASQKDPGKSHVKTVRPQWLGCACCPPNLARLLASIDQYIYTQVQNEVVVNLFMNSEATLQLQDEVLHIQQETDYPWNGNGKFTLHCEGNQIVRFGVRIPNWVRNYQILFNNQEIKPKEENGYIFIEGNFKNDVLSFVFEMTIEKWHANSKVRSDIGKIAISRGPFIYCMEEVDNGQGLQKIVIKKNGKMSYQFHDSLLGGVGTIRIDGSYKEMNPKVQDVLYYRDYEEQVSKNKEIYLIPYFSWGNRGENEMQVWIREE